ncbi:hypothetical protein QYF36_001637 [Acer negundo]|nr:hypothetical protein QYF36_001637 [Acer negundo]
MAEMVIPSQFQRGFLLSMEGSSIWFFDLGDGKMFISICLISSEFCNCKREMNDEWWDNMDSPALYPSHRCKTVHLVRHAQGIHNVAGEKNHDAYSSDDYFDAHLTPLGWQQPLSTAAHLSQLGDFADSALSGSSLPQVDNLHKHVQETGLSKRIELVITSPLLRTIQTAVGVFGGEGYADRIDVPPLMEKKMQGTVNALPSQRSSISEYKALFPAIYFSLIESNDDILLEREIRETNEAVAKRGMEFLNWLWTLKERRLHHPSIKNEIGKHMASSDFATTNYPGKIPNGLDLPSDVAAEKHLN